MALDQTCDFSLIRYMPHPIKGEVLNIGFMLREHGPNTDGFADVRFTRDWRRVQCFNPDADIETLQALEGDIRAMLRGGAGGQAMLSKLNGYLSNAVLIDPPTAVLTDSPLDELDKLEPLYLQTPARGRKTPVGVARIRANMQRHFESAGVWPLMLKRIPVAQYTASGDPLKIDCGYRSNGVVKLFQAVSLASDIDSAKSLALSYPDLVEAVARKENAATELTAVVEDNLNRTLPAATFAIRKLEKAEIRVRREAELPVMAAQARQDLRL